MQKFALSLVTATMLIGAAATSMAADGRDYISVVGSSTVYPFSTAVAEQFGKATIDRIRNFK